MLDNSGYFNLKNLIIIQILNLFVRFKVFFYNCKIQI